MQKQKNSKLTIREKKEVDRLNRSDTLDRIRDKPLVCAPVVAPAVTAVSPP